MSKLYVGNRVENVDIGEELQRITRVNIVVDSDHMYTAGDDTGRTIEAVCPWGSQEMANAILSKLSNVAYKPFTAERAMISPAFEIGDAVTVGGVYSRIVGADINYGVSGLVDIYAPDIDQTDDEYPAQRTQQSSISRQLAKTNAKISETEEKIMAEVSGKVSEEQANALIKLALKAITLEISNVEGTTKFVLKGGGVELTSTQFDIYVKNVNIVGDLSANKITSGVFRAESLALDGLLSLTSGGINYGYLGLNLQKEGAAISGPGGIAFLVCTNDTAKISWNDENSFWTNKTGCYASKALQVFSDRRLKNTISYDLSREKEFFSRLKPCSFSYNSDESGRRRWGFIAQDLVEGAEQSGLDTEKIAVVTCDENGLYSVSYDDVFTLNVGVTLDLMQKVEQQERRIAELESIVKEMKANG